MIRTQPAFLPPVAGSLITCLAIYVLLGLSGCDRGKSAGPAGGHFLEVQALFETEPVASADDAAQDPAIWFNEKEPHNSRILATDRQRGLVVYDIEGRELQTLKRGRLNNVDLRREVMLGTKRRSIAVATNRTNNSLDVFEIEDNGYVQWLMEQPLPFEAPSATCMYASPAGQIYVFANDINGAYQQWQISAPRGPLKFELVREFSVAARPAGCAADDTTGVLYLGERAAGIWQMAADPGLSSSMIIVDHVDSGHLVVDIEGMDIYRSNPETGYLVVSSQGDSSYALYRLAGEPAYIGSFKIGNNPAAGIDGIQNSVGLAISSAAIGDHFPEGILAVQDASNQLPDANQNLKLVSWADIAAGFGP